MLPVLLLMGVDTFFGVDFDGAFLEDEVALVDFLDIITVTRNPRRPTCERPERMEEKKKEPAR